MNSRKNDEERTSFSDRLMESLEAAGFDSTPARFTVEFNLRADGSAVTVHGARKWLLGDAIPTQPRIQIIANWLGISAAWLRFGDSGNSEESAPARVASDLKSSELALLHDIRLLSDTNNSLLRAIVETMLRQEKQLTGTTSSLRSNQAG